jgi:3alpha(or 20beta)-hydroxysteroid dehydrogenase
MAELCEGRVCIVTGAGRGIGREHALMLARHGAKLVVNDLGGTMDGSGSETGPAHEVVAEIQALGGEAVANTDDISTWEGAQRLVGQAVDAFGQLDVLVNNAGILKFNALADTPLEEFRQVLEVNLVGTFLGMKAAIPAMKRAGGGSIVNISSTEGLAGTVFCGAYTASKFGVRGITKVAAIEYGGDKIRVNSVHPGGIDTPMTRAVMDEEGRKYVGKRVAGLKRMGEADEVAGVVLFLASDDSSYCTGAEFVVDGGVTASAGF